MSDPALVKVRSAAPDQVGATNLRVAGRVPMEVSRLSEGPPAMRRILQKQKITGRTADDLIAFTCDAAFTYRRDTLRRLVGRSDRRYAATQVKRLVANIERLVERISDLPPASRGRLNAAVARHTSRFFDTEGFGDIIAAIHVEAQTVSPQRRASAVQDAVFHPTKLVERTAPSELIDGWALIPAVTRAGVEADIRRAAPARSAVQLLRRISKSLMQHSGADRRGRFPSANRRYVKAVGDRWVELGLTVGRANHAEKGSRASVFQQFCNAALAFVGDAARITGQDVLNFKTASRKGAVQSASD